VLLVESVSFNLLSIAQLCDLGLICTFSDSEVVVTNKEDKSLIFKGFRHGNIYLVDFLSNDASLATCTTRIPSFYDENAHDGANICHIMYDNMTPNSVAS